MEQHFLSVLNMSFIGTFVIAAIIAARLLLKKAPKIISYTLWIVAGFRLVFPITIESIFSLIPFKSTPIPQNIGLQRVPRIDSGIRMIDNAVSASLPAATPAASINPLQIWITIGTYFWIFGMIAMVIYSVISIVLLKRRLQHASPAENNIYQADNLKTPFVIGFLQPRIYIPIGLSEEERRYVVLHEQTHIRRRDHIVKMMAFIILCLHWFNPAAWIAFFLMGADMEMSCDERVMKELGQEIKAAYSLSLVRVASGHKIMNGSPLAFGEGGMKERIKNILRFKKHSRSIIVLSVTFVIVLIAGFSVNRMNKQADERKWDRHPMIMVDGQIYLDTGKEIAGETGDIPIVGRIMSSVDISEEPTQDSESNFGREGTVYGFYDSGLAVLLEDKWFFFEKEIESETDANSNIETNRGTEDRRNMTLDDVRELALKYKEDLKMDHLSGFIGIEVGSGLQIIQYYVENSYFLMVGSGDGRSIMYANLIYATEGGENESIDIRYYDVDKFIADGTKEIIIEPPLDLVDLPDFKPENPEGVYDGEIDGKVYGGIFNSAILNKYGGFSSEFLVYAPTIHGVYEEEGKLRALLTVDYEYYRLRGKTLEERGGGVIPAFITFRQGGNGDWILEEYIAVGDSPGYLDGAYFKDSIHKMCVMPVSGKKIEGLADKILEDYSDNQARSQLLRESLIEHLLQYGQTDVYLKKLNGSTEKLT